jgi:predicted metal-dependent hydrolase
MAYLVAPLVRFDYLRPDFHPNDHDTSEYLEYYKDKLLKEGGAIAPYL